MFIRVVRPVLAVLCACNLTWLQAQNPTIKLDVDLVTVNATVTDSENRPFTDLRTEHFQIWEDKVEQQIQYVSVEDVPISLGIIFDVSGSMERKLAAARHAAVSFLKNGNPDDEYFLIEFGSHVEVTQDYSSDVGNLQGHILFTSAKGMTAMYDAIYLGLQKLDSGRNTRKALLLITDGEDNHSRYNAANIKDFLKEKDVQVYAIGIQDLMQTRGEGVRRATIDELTDITGGRSFFINSSPALEDACLIIATQLKSQYVVGYRPTNPAKDGKWRKVRIKISPPKGVSHLTVRSKAGYYAPTGGYASNP